MLPAARLTVPLRSWLHVLCPPAGGGAPTLPGTEGFQLEAASAQTPLPLLAQAQLRRVSPGGANSPAGAAEGGGLGGRGEGLIWSRQAGGPIGALSRALDRGAVRPTAILGARRAAKERCVRPAPRLSVCAPRCGEL